MNQLETLKQEALDRMKEAGFPITGEVAVRVDEKLSFMGYTTEEDGQPVIVVSGNALSSGMAINLLIHELSHVYRIQTGHPSHKYQLLSTITAWILHGRVVLPDQEESIRTILNHIQDLYADDISFKIFAQNEHQQNLNEFFMEWIHTPVKAKSVEQVWTNAGYLLSAAFAQANLERHNVPDTGGKVGKAIEKFLSQTSPRMASQYEFFKDFMVNLPEDITDKEFETLLIRYLSEFLKLTKNS